MGMFDYVICELPLPSLPEREENGRKILSYPFKKDHSFQTKDLINALTEYKINEKGLLLRRVAEYEERELSEEEKKDRESGGFWSPLWAYEEISHKWVQEEHTGYVNFYDFIHNVSEDTDAWVEYRVHIKDGKVKGKVELFRCDYEDNSKRLRNSKELEEKMRAIEEYKKKWRYKYFGKYWNIFVFFVFTRLRKVGGWLSDSWKLESKFKF